MSQPDYTIEKSDRTRGGGLSTGAVQLLSGKLMRRGYILLPSDTCYSLAAIAIDDTVHGRINAILNRGDDPISLAFPSYFQLQQFVHVDRVAAALLEQFTPGPITVVCRANEKIPKRFLTHTIKSGRGTIGVRIPDSYVERDIAASTPYPLTTVAVRDPKTKREIRDFSRALRVVGAGIERCGGAGWAAVAGEAFYAHHSTVVEVVGGAEGVTLLRKGDIPFDRIVAASVDISHLAMGDWT